MRDHQMTFLISLKNFGFGIDIDQEPTYIPDKPLRLVFKKNYPLEGIDRVFKTDPVTLDFAFKVVDIFTSGGVA